MNPNTGEMREIYADMMAGEDNKKKLEDLATKLGALKVEGFTTMFQVGEEVQIKDCLFRIEYIRSGKEPIMTVVGLPKK